MDKLSENINKEIENIEKNQSEWDNIITEKNNTLKIIKSRLENAGKWISDLDDKERKSNSGKKKKKRVKQMRIVEGACGTTSKVLTFAL